MQGLRDDMREALSKFGEINELLWPLLEAAEVSAEMVSITHMVIVQRFIRTASSWYVLTLTAYMPQGRLAQCSILQAYHYISLIMNNIGNKHY